MPVIWKPSAVPAIVSVRLWGVELVHESVPASVTGDFVDQRQGLGERRWIDDPDRVRARRRRCGRDRSRQVAVGARAGAADAEGVGAERLARAQQAREDGGTGSQPERDERRVPEHGLSPRTGRESAAERPDMKP